MHPSLLLSSPEVELPMDLEHLNPALIDEVHRLQLTVGQQAFVRGDKTVRSHHDRPVSRGTVVYGVRTMGSNKRDARCKIV